MKLQNKAGGIMLLFGMGVWLLLTVGYDALSHRLVLEKELKKIESLSQEGAFHMDSHLGEKAAVTLTIATAPILQEALRKSNSHFSLFSDEKREQVIDALNNQWKSTTDDDDPFIQARLTNPVADYLKQQQHILPGNYGEIFLTNRYGAMIASTGRLSTLAHAHKYWWQAGYDNGRGRLFFDDRGFDASVKGYVLGVVVPIRDESGIIGILKSNVNIMGPLTNIIEDYALHHAGALHIVRSKGLIVAGKGLPPLSSRISKNLTILLQRKETGSTRITEGGVMKLAAFAPIKITMGSDRYGFGGSYGSLDHIKGNTGEAWHVVITHDESLAIEAAHETTRLLVAGGIIIILLSSAIASFLGRLITKPIVRIEAVARSIGGGNLKARADVAAQDEIGSLARSLNTMVERIQDTMASRDDLALEIERRMIVEEKLQMQATTDELTGSLNRRAFAESLQNNIGRAKRYEEPLSLLMFDIDYFKRINDTHGHDVGDRVLIDLVRVAGKSIRREDIMARWGGEEFMVLLPQTGKDAALQLAERLREDISVHDFLLPNQVTVSIGLAQFDSADTSDSLVQRVDKALYAAKEGGRNMVKAT